MKIRQSHVIKTPFAQRPLENSVSRGDSSKQSDNARCVVLVLCHVVRNELVPKCANARW